MNQVAVKEEHYIYLAETKAIAELVHNHLKNSFDSYNDFIFIEYHGGLYYSSFVNKNDDEFNKMNDEAFKYRKIVLPTELFKLTFEV